MGKGAGPRGADELYWQEREILRRKVELYMRGEYRESLDEYIHFRVPPFIKRIYRMAPDDVKMAARKAFESTLVAWFLGSSVSSSQSGDKSNIILNVNVNVATAKAEAKADLSAIAELARELYKLRAAVPPKQRELIEQLYSELRKAGVN